MFGMFAMRGKPRARDAMIGDVPTIGKDVRLSEVSPLIEGGRCAVVVDGERRPIGIVTEDDVEYARRRGLEGAPAWMVMQEDPLTVREDEPLESAIRRMEEARASCMPVVDQRGRLVGLLVGKAERVARAPVLTAVA
ncbi:MAG: CBS domain-containing protein [Conexivisphaera sp.]